MGAALAKRAMLRGAKVTLIAGKTECELPNFVDVIKVKSAEDMYNAVRACAYKQDIIIKAAAVADYTPKIVAEQKIKKMMEI